MQKNLIFKLITLAMISILPTACSTDEQIEDTIEPFEDITIEQPQTQIEDGIVPLADMTPFEITAIFNVSQTDETGQKELSLYFERPVFDEKYEHAEKLNALFDLIIPYSSEYIKDTQVMPESLVLSAFQKEVDLWKNSQLTHLFSYETRTTTTYQKNNIVSFLSNTNLAYPDDFFYYRFDTGHVINLETGTELAISDILNVDESNFAQIFVGEFVSQNPAPNDGEWDYNNIAEIQDYASLEQDFYLSEQGIHIIFDVFDEYYESDEIIVPFTHVDLVKDEFRK